MKEFSEGRRLVSAITTLLHSDGVQFAEYAENFKARIGTIAFVAVDTASEEAQAIIEAHDQRSVREEAVNYVHVVRLNRNAKVAYEVIACR